MVHVLRTDLALLAMLSHFTEALQIISPEVQTATHMNIDGPSMENLELVQGPEGTVHGSLLEVLDHCVSHGGKRLLRTWLCRPLYDVAQIVSRQQAVAALQASPMLLDEVHNGMRRHPDLPRFASAVLACQCVQVWRVSKCVVAAVYSRTCGG